MKVRGKLWLAGALFCAIALQAQEAQKWQIGPFTRPQSGNPVIAPRPESVFVDPILKKPVHWETLHTFNPAAIVRDGKVYVLYRAEDDSGAMEIGGHTSRLGLAESKDGVTFTPRADPVFFPADDAQQSREWPGGVEDPRIVEAASQAHEPHRIAFYLFDLASEFHALYTLGNNAPHLRFIIQNDRELTLARLVLVQGVVTVLASGLRLLGVEAPSEMR